MSPFLFLIVMDVLTEQVRQEMPWSMVFADDIEICGGDDETMSILRHGEKRWKIRVYEDHKNKHSISGLSV